MRHGSAKKVLYTIFFINSGLLMHISFPKTRGVSGSFYKNVILKIKMQTKMRKVHPNNWAQLFKANDIVS